jgi:hypothetical protein
MSSRHRRFLAYVRTSGGYFRSSPASLAGAYFVRRLQSSRFKRGRFDLNDASGNQKSEELNTVTARYGETFKV